ncbi:MAG: PEP-CTERM sorting domain-containing protein [Limnoraphis robusta]
MSYKLLTSGLLATIVVIGAIAAPAQAKPDNANTNPNKPNNDNPLATEEIVQQALGSLSCEAGTVNATDALGNVYGATKCAGTYEGNDTGAGDPLLTLLKSGDLFGEEIGSWDWELSGKSDGNKGAFGITAPGSNSGNWSLSTALESPFILSLKSSTSWSAYYFENLDSAITGGFFNTLGVAVNENNGQGKGLSHASLFVASKQFVDEPDSQEVPEPGTLLGLLTLGGVVFGKKVISRKS